MTQRATSSDELIDDIARRAARIALAEMRASLTAAVIDAMAGAGAAGERMDAAAAGKYLGIAPRTLYTWIRQGKGPPHRRMGRKLVFDRRELDLWSSAGGGR